MDTKKIIILGLILIAIVGSILLSEKLGSRQKSGASGEFFPGFSEATCSAIRITEGNNSVTIRKKGNVWVVSKNTETNAGTGTGNVLDQSTTQNTGGPFDDYPADSASVAAVLEKIASMKKDELISQNPDKQGLFEVDSAKGTLVEIWDAKNVKTGTFKIGKNGADWSSHFVRVIGSNDVYSVGGSIKYSFYTEESRWRNKTVLSFDKNEAKKLTLTKNDLGPVVLEKSVDTAGVARWNIIAPKQVPADSTESTKLLNELATFTTSKWEEDQAIPESDMGFDAPEFIGSIEMKNGDQKMITVGKKKGDTSEYWVKTNDKAVIFLIPEYKINNIKKGFDDLKQKDVADNVK